ncbi:MAG: DUF5723 family protein, partial [Chloroflexota bacterium]
MTTPDWSLRDATIVDLGFIFRVYRTTMKDYIEAVYEWNEQTQISGSVLDLGFIYNSKDVLSY